MTDMLRQSDVTRLLHDKSAESRTDTATKLAAHFQSGELTEEERRIAEDILRVMAHDAEVRVREALSLNLKESGAVPHDVAVALASDVDAVSLPMLEFSKVLNEADLVEIVRTQNVVKQKAIARREAVPSKVVDALVDTENEEVVAEVVSNEGAEMTANSMERVLDSFGENERIQTSMVRRTKLPVTIAERLVVLVSENLRDHLMVHHELSADVSGDLILQARERATMGLLSGGADQRDVESLVRQLDENGRLTPTIMLRALCMGDTTFFEAAMARRAGIPLTNAQILMHDEGPLGLKSVFDAAKMPASLFPAVRVAIRVASETEYDGGANDRERYSRRMLERILTQYEDIDADDLEYLLGKLSKLGRAVTQEKSAAIRP